MRPRGMRSAWKKMTSTYGFWQKQPTRADELRSVIAGEEHGSRADLAEQEARLGECPRHHCNGDCVVNGAGSDVCDWQCHPGLATDPVRAARYEEILAEFGLP